MTKLVEIEGIGEVYAAKLEEIGIKTIESLLEKGATPAGRTHLEKESQIPHKLMLKWINRADLARIKGVSTQYADLLEFSGVDTVPELAQRNAKNLHEKMTEVNEEKHLVRQLPSLNVVEKWVAEAKLLPRVITY